MILMGMGAELRLLYSFFGSEGSSCHSSSHRLFEPYNFPFSGKGLQSVFRSQTVFLDRVQYCFHASDGPRVSHVR